MQDVVEECARPVLVSRRTFVRAVIRRHLITTAAVIAARVVITAAIIIITTSVIAAVIIVAAAGTTAAATSALTAPRGFAMTGLIPVLVVAVLDRRASAVCADARRRDREGAIGSVL